MSTQTTTSVTSATNPLTLAPDVGTIVEYGLTGLGKPAHYRVTAWVRIAPPPPPVEPGSVDDILQDILYEACQEILDKRDGLKKRMQYCLREEATHLKLTGVCGAIAAVEHCHVIGKVSWSEADIAEGREMAIRLANQNRMIG